MQGYLWHPVEGQVNRLMSMYPANYMRQHTSKNVALLDPVMPVTDGLLGWLVRLDSS